VRRQARRGRPAAPLRPPRPTTWTPRRPVRWLYYTSGTTAEPKGARHTDLALRTAAIGMSERLHLAEDDRFALVFPFTHVAGALYIYAALAYGMTFVRRRRFNPATTIDLLRREKVTQAGAGTFFHQTYLKAQQDLPEGERAVPRCARSPAAVRPSRPSSTTTSRPPSGAQASCRAGA
jgi:acyl-CoA synthetase (AMP-forming)/AMP-acid ligase II